MKYIVMEDERGNKDIFVFPRNINHDCMAEMLKGIKDQTRGNWERVFRKPVSAGFVNKSLTCYGSSESLGISSCPGDTDLLRKEMEK